MTSRGWGWSALFSVEWGQVLSCALGAFVPVRAESLGKDVSLARTLKQKMHSATHALPMNPVFATKGALIGLAIFCLPVLHLNTMHFQHPCPLECSSSLHYNYIPCAQLKRTPKNKMPVQRMHETPFNANIHSWLPIIIYGASSHGGFASTKVLIPEVKMPPKNNRVWWYPSSNPKDWCQQCLKT